MMILVHMRTATGKDGPELPLLQRISAASEIAAQINASHSSSNSIRRQTHWLQVIYKSLLGKAPPYLSSLFTITTPTRSTRSSRYISLVIPKANTSFGCLSFQFSAANDWNELQKPLKLETYISLANFKHQLSEQLTDRCSCTQPICK